MSHPMVTLAPKGTETILLAEDEDGVRRLITRILDTAGYTILQAHDEEGALAMCRTYQGRIHLLLLITDMIMPRLHGRRRGLP
jgi:two-component system cell cycle sensor histidine kinase/response regulator CckA